MNKVFFGGRKYHTVALVIAAIRLVELAAIALLSVVLLLVVWLLVELLLLELRLVSSVCSLTGLERSSARCERSGARLERVDVWLEAALRGGGVHVKLLLSPLGEVVILSRRIILPRVRGRHCDVFWAAVGWDMSRRIGWARGEESKSSKVEGFAIGRCGLMGVADLKGPRYAACFVENGACFDCTNV